MKSKISINKIQPAFAKSGLLPTYLYKFSYTSLEKIIIPSIIRGKTIIWFFV